MSRSGYVDDWGDCQWQWALALGSLNRAVMGRRGQRMFRDLLAALDAMPAKRLIANELETEAGEVCALGALGRARGVDNLKRIDPEDADKVAQTFDIATCLAREVVYVNDEVGPDSETPEQRWTRIRSWVVRQIEAGAER